MRLIRFLPFMLLASANPMTALAEIGDIHTIKVKSAVVREAPEKKGKKVESISRGSEVMEMDTEGEWMEIYVASTDLSGWMHLSTIQILGSGTATAAPSATTRKATEAKPQKLKLTGGSSSEGFKIFKKYLVKYNARTFVLKGYTPFFGATDNDDGKLVVTVTDAWANNSRARQKSSLIILNSRWKKASGSSNSQIIAVDEAGVELLRYPN